MCLAIPMKVVALGGGEAVVEESGVRRRARLDLVPDVSEGDYVLVHAGFAIAKVQEEDALETLAILREISR